MKSNFGVFACTVLTFGFVLYACASGEVVDGPATGTGGAGNTVGTAGTTGTGNNIAGTTGGGNQTGRGGTTGGGNQVGTAGTTGAGNTVGSAGTTGAGNTVGTAGRGGTTGTGNTVGTAGTTGAGNTVGTAGTTGSGGSTGVCPPSFEATTGGLVQMPASGGGCWRGYAFTFTETPNCGSTITPKDFSTCSTTCALMASGMVASATATNSYCGVVGLGFSINQPPGTSTPATLAPTGNGIKVAFSETATALKFRVQLRDDSTSTGYCYEVTGTSPVMIPYGMFNTKCYDSPPDGVAYAKTPFTSVQILIAGGAAATAFNMTLTSVSEY
jgi:hypothetical protein